MQKLKELGWNNYFQQHFDLGSEIKEQAEEQEEGDSAHTSRIPSRVTGAFRNSYTIRQVDQGRQGRQNGQGETRELHAVVSGRFQHEAEVKSDFPVIGDWVVVTNILGEDKATIHELLPRQTELSRHVQSSDQEGASREKQIMASNVDIVFIVSSLNLDLNLRRLERYLAMVSESGAQPVILLTKSDLCSDVDAKAQSMKSIARTAPVHVVSAHENEGLNHVMPYLFEGQTCVLVGSSGAGKSTLVNWMMGKELAATKEIRSGDDKGKHTTTIRELYFLPKGGMIIDTPGIRSLQIEDESALDDTFDDVAGLKSECRFVDCKHHSEPGCAVLAAIQDGDMEEGRLRNYHKLSKEVAYEERRSDKKSAWKSRQEDKKLSKEINRIQKVKRSR